MTSNNTTQYNEHHCKVREQRYLVSEMSRCDQTRSDSKSLYECYMTVSQNNRETKACMYS